jgi:hypothetical protein
MIDLRRSARVFITLAACVALVGCSSTVATSTSTSASTGTGTATTTSVHGTPRPCPNDFIQQPTSTQTPDGTLPVILPTQLSYVVLCRYGVLPREELTKSVTVSAPGELALLRAEVNRLVPLSPNDRYPCPMDRGARIDAYFGSASGTLELRFDVSGCQFITGSNTAYYGLSTPSHRLLLEVESLVH